MESMCGNQHLNHCDISIMGSLFMDGVSMLHGFSILACKAHRKGQGQVSGSNGIMKSKSKSCAGKFEASMKNSCV